MVFARWFQISKLKPNWNIIIAIFELSRKKIDGTLTLAFFSAYMPYSSQKFDNNDSSWPYSTPFLYNCLHVSDWAAAPSDFWANWVRGSLCTWHQIENAFWTFGGNITSPVLALPNIPPSHCTTSKRKLKRRSFQEIAYLLLLASVI